MSKKKAKREARKIIRGYSLAIGASVLVALFIRLFLLEAYRMPSRAMFPALEPGDTLFVSKHAYGFRIPLSGKWLSKKNPKYGDVAVLEFSDEPGREYIKRVVGLPGDKVQLVRGTLLLNGKIVTAGPASEALCATETLPNAISYPICFEPPLLSMPSVIEVPENHAFVVGDFRTLPGESRQTKTLGLVPFGGFHGKAEFIWLSIQPPTAVPGADWFSRIRINRLFKAIR